MRRIITCSILTVVGILLKDLSYLLNIWILRAIGGVISIVCGIMLIRALRILDKKQHERQGNLDQTTQQINRDQFQYREEILAQGTFSVVSDGVVSRIDPKD